MNEHTRMQYLEAMGVDVFVPRFLFSNAKPSLQCEFAAVADSHSTEQHGQPVPQTQRAAPTEPQPSSIGTETLRTLSGGLNSVLAALESPAVENLAASPTQTTATQKTEKSSSNPEVREAANSIAVDQSVDRKVDQDVAQAHDETKLTAINNDARTVSEMAQLDERANSISGSHETPVTQSKLNAEAVEFQLTLWRTQNNLQIIDSREPQDALPTEALLSNILLATGLFTKANSTKTQSTKTHSTTALSSVALGTSEIQHWPMPGALSTDKSWSAASAMLLEFFSARFEKHAPDNILLFGEYACKALLGADFKYASHLYQVVEVKPFGISAVVMPALRELLYKPELKREIWQALRLQSN